MAVKTRRLRAIDLYSGVGGWSLGLHLSGIDVVASYDCWGAANETNFKNNGHQAQTIDIRRLELADLPKDIDVVVGSPPCTQFSYSNRGGLGDISDGLRDIVKFLDIVDHLNPRIWAMENVPRIARIMETELKPGGKLRRFKHLDAKLLVVNMEEFGLPQRRRRCIVGNFDSQLLLSYRGGLPARTLGDVIRALGADPVIDPLYGIKIPRKDLRDQIIEAPLDAEEERINRAGKVAHPVYNSMSFPDPLNRSVRTITATCTRVCRESIIIEHAGKGGKLRRLTVRERASLQGFPVTYQFYCSSFSQKIRMVGNAIPPLFTYYLGHAFRGTAPETVPVLPSVGSKLKSPNPQSFDSLPSKAGTIYVEQRTFRFAIPSLRLKSGVRFELTNDFSIGNPGWRVAFYFGTSKAIQTLELNEALFSYIARRMPKSIYSKVANELSILSDSIAQADIENLQRVWSRRGPGLTRPFMILDELDEA